MLALRIATVLVIVGLVGPAGAAETVDLRWRFQKGEVLKYLLRHREVKTVELGDQKFETTTTSEFDLQWTVLEVDERGTATIAQKLTGLRVTISGKDFEFQYDSSRGNEGGDDYKRELIQLYDQLRFAEYPLEIDAVGRVLRVQGFDKLWSELALTKGIADFHGLHLRDATFAWVLQQALGQVPAQPVGKGERWETPLDTKLADIGHLTGRSTFVLAGPVDARGVPCQEIEVKSTQSMDLDTKWLNGPLRGPLKSTKVAGKVRVDPKARRVQSSEVQVNLDGDLKFGRGANPTPMKVQFQHTLELEARR